MPTELAKGTLLWRFMACRGTSTCFVCSLDNNRTLGYVSMAWSADSHTRIVHEHCLRLVLKYAQRQVAAQAEGEP
jgi:hypothetical protein